MLYCAQIALRHVARPRTLLLALATAALLVSTSAQALAWDHLSNSSTSIEAEQSSNGQQAPSLLAQPYPATDESGQAEAAPASVSYGDLIADTALTYVGYPYAYAGAGPYGFDCSGFTQYIVGITTGIWISHAVEAQPYSAGVWVDYGNWLPGDLIFFQNTYRAGISHVGIYLGDGMMVHAENESTGVTIDSIYSSYYGPRYWGAVRIA